MRARRRHEAGNDPRRAARGLVWSALAWLAGRDMSGRLRDKVRCNAICPAAILTPMWEPMLGQGPDRAARMAACVADTPLRRFGTPEEVAAVAVLLASDECAYLTGSEIHVDGGLLAGAAAPIGG